MVQVKIITFHCGILILHILDMFITSRALPSQEINPIAKALWIQHGFLWLICLKCLGWGFMLTYHLIVQKWLPSYAYVVWLSMSMGFVMMIVLVASNFILVF